MNYKTNRFWVVAAIWSLCAVNTWAYEVGDPIVVVTEGGADLNVDGKAVGKIGQWARVTVEEVNGEWLWVRHATAGWMSSKDVKSVDEAISRLNDEISQRPQDDRVRHARGFLSYCKGEYGTAFDDLDEAISLNPNNSGHFNDRGLVREAKGDHHLAIVDFNEAIRLSEGKFSIQFENRGVSWLHSSKPDDAITDFSEAIRLNAKSVGGYLSRGEAFAFKHDYGKAIDDYTQAISLDPRSAAGYQKRGLAWRLSGQYEKAIADYTQAITVNGRFAAAYEGLARIRGASPHAQYRNGQQAVEYATKACKLTHWKSAYELDLLAIAHAEAGDFSEALKYEQQALPLATTDFVKNGIVARAKLSENQQPFRDNPQATTSAALVRDDSITHHTQPLSQSTSVPIPADPAGKPKLVLDSGGHTGRISRVFFNPTGGEIFTTAADGTVRVWNLVKGESIRVFRPPTGSLLAGAVAPNGRTIAVGGVGNEALKGGLGSIYLIGLASGEVEQVLRGHKGAISALAFSPNGKWLASGSSDHSARLWNLSAGQCEQTLEGHSLSLSNVAFSPDSMRLATTSWDGTACIWSVMTGRSEHVLKGHEQPVHGVSWSPDGKTLATGGYDHSVRLWDADGSLRQTFTLDSPVESVTVSSNGRELLVTRAAPGKSFACSVLSMGTGNERIQFTGHTNTVQWGDLSPDGALAATVGGDNNELCVWKTTDGGMVSRMVGQGKGVKTTAWSENGHAVAWGSRKDRVGPTRPLEHTFDLQRFDFGFEADSSFRRAQLNMGSLSLSLTPTHTLSVKQDGKEITALKLDTTDITHGFSWLPNNQIAVVGRGIQVFDSLTGRLVHRLYGPTSDVHDVSPSSDDRYLLVGSSDQVLRIYALEDMKKEWSGIGIIDRVIDGDFTVVSVVPGGPAALDGRIKEKDKIVAVEGPDGQFVDVSNTKNVVENAKTIADVGQLLRGLEGTKVRLKIIPAGQDTPVVYELTRQKVGYSVAHSYPLLSLFFAGDEWIAWTSEGYYAASPGGEKLMGWQVNNGLDRMSRDLSRSRPMMGWQVNNGLDRMATFYPAAQFRNSLYRPDVIKKLLEAGSVEKALSLIDQERGATTERVDVSQVLPPKVAITFPAKSGTEMSTTRFEVKVAATSTSQPVTSFRLLVDGRPYNGEASLRTVRAAAAGEVRESWTVELTPGAHRLAVIAASTVSQGLSDEIEVLVVPDSGPVGPPSAALHLLSVGINAYPGRLKLDCAAPDARTIDEAFRTHGKGLYQVRTNLLLDERATRSAILSGLDLLAKNAKAGDVAIVYYAGHGDCKITGQFQILPVDVDISKLAQTGVSGDELRGHLARLPCTALLIMDCCYAGSFDAGKKKRALPTQAGDLVRELVSDDQGLVVMCGASKEQESGEEAKLGHGYFTQAMSEGLAGKAASKRDGLVYLSGLQVYVEERVREFSNDEQYPTIGKPTLIRSFPLSKP